MIVHNTVLQLIKIQNYLHVLKDRLSGYESEGYLGVLLGESGLLLDLRASIDLLLVSESIRVPPGSLSGDGLFAPGLVGSNLLNQILFLSIKSFNWKIKILG